MHWDIANVVKGEKGVSGFGLLSILHYVTKGLWYLIIKYNE